MQVIGFTISYTPTCLGDPSPPLQEPSLSMFAPPHSLQHAQQNFGKMIATTQSKAQVDMQVNNDNIACC